jgi:regulator of protease activity HflC (stomatin/prohibitin superfamily)
MWAIFSIIGAVVGLIISLASVKMREPIIQRMGYVVTLVFTILTGLCCLTIVPAGHVGVPVTLGKVNVDANLSEGLKVVNPFASVYDKSIQTENYTMSKVADQGEIQGDDSIVALSKEGMKMPLDVTVVYRQIGKDAGWVHQTFGEAWRDVLVRSPSRTSVREACAVFEGSESYSEKREDFAKKIAEKLTARVKNLVADRGGENRTAIKIVDVQLREVGLPTQITDAIEKKLKAQQEEEEMVFVIGKQEKEKERMDIEGDAISSYNGKIEKSLTDGVLKFKAIEVMEKLAQSPNSKVYIIGGGEGGMPLIMNDSVK